jgi:hypothetical protein
MPLATPRERVAAIAELLGALARFGDPPAAAAFVRVLATERTLAASELAVAISGFLDRLRGSGGDLHEGAVRLSRAGAARKEPAGNGELLARAGEAWS